MKFFGKKKENEKCCCGNCSSDATEKTGDIKENFSIKVLGSGCAKCHTLLENTKAAVQEIGANVSVEMITDFSKIASYGVMSTPALAIGDKVVSYGKVLDKEEVLKILRDNLL